MSSFANLRPDKQQLRVNQQIIIDRQLWRGNRPVLGHRFRLGVDRLPQNRVLLKLALPSFSAIIVAATHVATLPPLTKSDNARVPHLKLNPAPINNRSNPINPTLSKPSPRWNSTPIFLHSGVPLPPNSPFSAPKTELYHRELFRATFLNFPEKGGWEG
ncbi:hypothetical protein CRG98_041601 [Punica granatum]|uniref:Uncharacterized protein n=1 Tax=Punica granatum TaxID=22663 RepID=A0A2I0I210_PUNGR|nr:hypothetical protein CRG98_041601 [Punica granatum]